MFYKYVTSVLYECCKSRSGYCICYNGCTWMLQASIPNASSVFSDACYKCIYLDIAFISHICCKCFMKMFRLFAMVSSISASVSDTCFKCFICLQRYVTSDASEYFKTRHMFCNTTSAVVFNERIMFSLTIN
jgi:hypothetical protein